MGTLNFLDSGRARLGRFKSLGSILTHSSRVLESLFSPLAKGGWGGWSSAQTGHRVCEGETGWTSLSERERLNKRLKS